MAYVDLTSRFTYNMQTVFGDFSKLANNDKFIKENGWQDGTVWIFFQSSAPTGWTKITTTTGKALRVTSGTGGGAGGSNDPGSSISLAHTHSVSTEAAHTHAITTHTHHLAAAGPDAAAATGHAKVGTNGSTTSLRSLEGASGSSVTSKKNALPLSGSYSTGSGGSHNHTGLTDSQLSTIVLAYVNVIFASKATSSGYTDLSATFVHNTRHVFDYLDQLAENDGYNYARRTPATTVSLFGSSAAPTGWTTLVTQNGKLVRIVSDTTGGSAGGTTDPSAAISLAHTHAISSDGAHTHSSPAHAHVMSDSTTYPTTGVNRYFRMTTEIIETDGIGGITALPTSDTTETDGSGTTTSNGAHTHTTGSSLGSISLAYLNVIQASKDSAGAPYVYADMTTFFLDQALLAYQDLQTMAYNDAYLYFHVMPTSAVTFFFQASAPLNWTKVTTQNDCIVRIVSDSSGGTTGGVDALSTVSLAHTHTIPNASHTHTFAHTHAIAAGPDTLFNGTGTGRSLFGAADAELYRADRGGAGDPSLGNTTDSQSLTTDSNSHNHGGATGSSLSALSLGYADVIQCSKS